ncbi:MAG: tRNA(Met) cytidine acetyltransferase, partial [Thermoplasmata archaeon]|nr:tRNA(Met) cytidine acetyltransferase [Thermoplasmata archaeon]
KVVREGLTNPDKWRRREVEADEEDPLYPLKRMAKTEDQLRGIEEIIRFTESSTERKVLLLLADRGRGKSAALGLSAAGCVAEGRAGKIVLTSPERTMAEEAVKFFKKGLFSLKVSFQERPGGLMEGEGPGGRWSFQYLPPTTATAGRWDLLLVDEAAAIPYRLLLKLARRSPSPIFSTTIHGYEGAGRSFTVKFIQGLTEDGFDIKRVRMEEPIRHAPSDPVEKWLFRVLMLSAEPGEMPSKVDRKKLKFLLEPAGEVLERDEEFFRRYFGIFILAHYKNTPNDLAILLDGANQRMATLVHKGTPLVALQIADEGGLSPSTLERIYSGWIPPGNLIPDCFIKYYRDEVLGTLKGIRVVRIATHPYLQRRGLGTEALKRFEERARAEGYDYVGTSFGASSDLLNFWLRSGYTPIHLSPSPNPVSGEHSVIMVKPLTDKLRRRMNELKSSFIRRTLEGLPDPLRDVEPEVVRLLLDPPSVDFHLHLDELDLKRAVAYAWGTMTYVVSRDVVLPYVKAYFSTKKRPVLERKEELLLISRVLQCRPWEECSRMIRKGPVYTMIKLKDILKILISYFTGGEIVEREIKRYPKRG